MSLGWRRVAWRLGLLLLAGLWLTGCATTKVDWNARIGVFTYDQAILDLGPPDKSAQTSEGVLVADWLIRRGHVWIHGPLLPPWYYPYAYGTPVETYSPAQFLRLTFARDGRLQKFDRYYR